MIDPNQATTATGSAAVTADNNWLTSTEAVAFDKALSVCRRLGSNCQDVIDQWQQVSNKRSAEIDQRLKDYPLTAQVVDEELVRDGLSSFQWSDKLADQTLIDQNIQEVLRTYHCAQV